MAYSSSISPKYYPRKSGGTKSLLTQIHGVLNRSSQSNSTEKSDDNKKSTNFKNVVGKNLKALYHFSRPYTMTATIIGIITMSLLPLQSLDDLTPTFFRGLLKGLVPTLLMNMYGVGINQLYDVEMDKVNKPDLPLASGDFSRRTGIAIVSTSFLMSIGTAIMSQSPPVFSGVFVLFLLGTAYSVDLPFLRWKKHPFLTTMCILITRAVVIPLAFYIHMQKYVLGRALVIPKSITFTFVFTCFVSTVIAQVKDFPDMEGDREFGMQNLSIRLGPQRVFWVSVKLLLVAYGGAVTVGVCSSFPLSGLVTIFGHSTLACLLWHRAKTVDLYSKTSTFSFYMFIWKLFYAEYFLIPFIR